MALNIHREKFAHEYAFQHVTSSRKYPQSKGATDGAVQKKNDPYMALSVYRTSQLENGASLAELSLGRKLRSTVPTLPKVLQSELSDATQIRLKTESRALPKLSFYRKHCAKELTALSLGGKVWIKDLERQTKVISAAPRSDVVESCGGTVRRNRRSLPALCEPSDVLPDISSTDTQIAALG